jgi:hypothetical protein
MVEDLVDHGDIGALLIQEDAQLVEDLPREGRRGGETREVNHGMGRRGRFLAGA